ncbi:MAG TPA: cytochrome c peroxidase, partial [Planctomycetota bacterium]|nr:cytochrome c peroxidase [Planctomycetota bacterium]
TGRNAPNFIMSVFNRVNFWDGRAKRDFNGVTPFGPTDPSAPVIFVDNGAGLVATPVDISPASLASQAVGPPNNPTEMSCAGRTFPQLGSKLLARTPLGQQLVAADDSVLGALSNAPGNGLDTTYAEMIQAAFQDNLHASAATTPSGATQMEANFSLFWGLSILLYNSTLIPDNSPFDQFREGNASALTNNQKLGANVFANKGKCLSCHKGPTFTAAAVTGFSGGSAFVNTGVTPTAADGGRQPENKGKFKTPTIRNVELTGPYFHNGRYLTLMQVVEFYNRGGDVANSAKDSRIKPLGLTAAERNALVDFMLALTDDRVRNESAPFDHPSLGPANGDAVPAVGAGGRATPIGTFLGADPFAP